MSLPNHGANPKQFAEALAIKLPEQSEDFSVNTNPFGPPESVISLLASGLAEAASAYPDPHGTALKHAVAAANDLQPENVLLGNGAAELIFLIAAHFRGKRVGIIEPAFSEYREACEAYECEVESIVLPAPWELRLERILPLLPDLDLIFLCSPNNPTGISYSRDTIVALLQAAGDHKVYFAVDQAFYDFCLEDVELQSLLADHRRLIILRSLTKMYAIAGLRLGYLLAEPGLVQAIAHRQPPWSVNGLAQVAGEQALKEQRFVKQTVAMITAERERICAELERLAFVVSPSTVNFYLLSEQKKQDMKPLLLFLAEKGIVARHTYNFNGLDGHYIRLAVKQPEANERLLAVLREWRER
ncbi:threonine-phosphate decarboxylase CobD [Alkalihalobacillus oceani]|uniref:threonine-phosphate decarboxylase CobD n=1 Tax=Halalkalibacter oceani TaxID=1653776 RepID=UPI00204070FF|nr:threonine-phosphate decarboxylase CobD [Halalkalibacter oceani]MCM3762947.1 threonine-phosphate decarboxylase CobD [Halalkalibacter oceani]